MAEINLVLTRKLQSDQGTFGRLVGPGLSLHTAELPWRDNKNKISRIPYGIYACAPYSSPKFPEVYQILNVPGRDKILIHTGNHAGDVKLGWRSDVEGCILVGLDAGLLQGQEAVLSSRAALDKLRRLVGRNEFALEIREEWQG